VAVRVNDAATRWAYRAVVEVVAAAGRGLDAIILPKVTDPGHVVWLDLLLGQIEQDTGDEAGRIGIEAQIEDARGLAKVDEIAAAPAPAANGSCTRARSTSSTRPSRRARTTMSTRQACAGRSGSSRRA
jgi:citrate lyase beta subunit